MDQQREEDMDVAEDHFQVLGYKEKIPEGYSLVTLAQAQDQLALVMQAYKRNSAEFRGCVRLKNGLLDAEGVHRTYEERLECRLVTSKQKPGTKLTKEDCLIALAYAAEHDDVDDELQELVECAGKQILTTRMPMPFAFLGTILHVCTNWASNNTLAKVLRLYPESVDVYILDIYGDTALHNLPSERVPKSYEDCKKAAWLILNGLEYGVDANELLSKKNDYQGATALCKALIYKGQEHVCRALLDAGKEKQEKEEPATSDAAGKASHWLTLTARRCPYVGSIMVGDTDEDGDGDGDAVYTALHLAVLRKYGAVVTKILAYPGAEGLKLTSQQDHRGNTPLHLAARVADPEICSTLLKYSMQEINKDGGSAVRAVNKAGYTALHIAATRGLAEVCEKLLEYGASLSVPSTREGRYALTDAFARGHKQVVEKLLDARLRAAQDAPTSANSELTATKSKRSQLINERFEFGLTPLHVAIAMSLGIHVSCLLQAGALIDSRCDDGRTPLHFATQKYNTDTVYVLWKLLRAGEKLKGIKKWINVKDNLGRTALHNVVRLSRHSAKDQSQSRDKEGSEREIYSDSEDLGRKTKEICSMVKALLREGALVDLQDCEGETALHGAMRSDDQVVYTLLSGSKDVCNDRDKWIAMCDFSGETALHEAAREGRQNLVELLLTETKSCDDLLRVRDMKNMTALDYAAIKRDHEAMMDEMMQKHGINDITKDFLVWNLKEHVNPRVHEGYCKKYGVKENQTSLLQAAVKSEDVDIARELINRGVDVTSLEYDACRWLAVNFGKNASDQPTSEDTLGRKELVRGVATLLLNPYTQTPVTIGIFGSWGTGKSSFMLQVEEAMLYMAVKEIFRKIPINTPSHDKESVVLKFSRIGAALRYMVEKALKQRMIKGDTYNQSASGKALLAKILKAVKENISSTDDHPSTAAENQLPLKEDMILKEGKSACGKALLSKIIKAPKRNTPMPDIENHMNISHEDEASSSTMHSQSKYRQLFEALAKSESQSKYTQLFMDLASIDRSTSEYDIVKNFPVELQSMYHRLFKDLALLDIPKLENDMNSNSLMELQSQYRQLFADLASIDRSKLEYDTVNNFPMELQSKYLQLFKDLALTDRSKLVQSHSRSWNKTKSGINNQTLQDAQLIGYTPAVLTLHYNAWQYDNKTEASAGLAVELSHQLESFMTPHQWLRMCWKYSWKSRPRDMCVQVLLPIFLALVAICVILMLWKVVPIAKKYKDLSLPIGIVGVMWAFFKTSLQAIQPVTQALLNITKSIDHRSMLGYQHEVIDDIKFLIDQLCHDAHFGWKILGFLCQLFISNKYFMEDTWIWKQHPRLDNFRIVVFIDDLDRCDEKTILELLRAINLILGACGINVVIGVDKSMVERAITTEFLKDTVDKVFDMWVENTNKKVAPKIKEGLEAVENINKKTIPEAKTSQTMEINENVNDNKYSYTRDLADNYLQKIIQLPIQMPEPSATHIEHFLQGQVGQRLTRPQKDKMNEEGDSQSQESTEEGDSQSQESTEGGGEEKQMNHEGASDPIGFRLLLATYTPMEKDMLKRICRFTTKGRRIPRELKRFLNYHRLAWTILSQDQNMKSKKFKGWQRKLILWIFICWNWRDQMDDIFENWHDIISNTSRSQQMYLLQESKEKDGGILKLCDIINTHMESKGWSTKNGVNQNRGKQGGEIVQKSWNDLHSTLKEEYDIPIHFIEKFQQFRFYCKLNHLEIDEE